MADEKSLPSDDEMRSWVIEVPDEGPPPNVGKPLSAKEAAALKKRVDEARKKDRAAMSLLERMRRRCEIRQAPERWKAAAAARERGKEERERQQKPILSSMSEQGIREAGVRIDLPTEAASSDPKDIAYTDGTTLLGRLRRRQQEWEREHARRPPLTDEQIREAWNAADRAKGVGDANS